jgi:hypothetical protein
MPSFELFYEDEEDVLEVTFATFDEHFARAIPLNDHITLHTDATLTAVWGLSFYSYATLLQVSETYLDELRGIDEMQARRVLNLLHAPPASYFLELIAPGELRARVKAPSLQSML